MQKLVVGGGEGGLWLCPQLEGRGQSSRWGGLGAKPPSKSFSINAFCVTVRPFS